MTPFEWFVLTSGIGTGISNLLGGRSQSRAAEESARESARQFDLEFEYMKQIEARNFAMWLASQEAQGEYLAFEEAKDRAEWESTADLQSPYRAASAAILGKTMGMDVPAYRPTYAAGESPRESPYKDFISERRA